MDIDSIHIAIKLFDFAALFCCIGLLLARLVLLRPEAYASRSVMRRWHRQLGMALVLMTLTGLALPFIRVMQMSGMRAAEVISLLPSVLGQTHFGKTWSIHLLGVLALWICWGAQASAPRRWPACIMLAALYLLTLTYSATSHAADAGDFTLSEWNDCVHLAASASWGGGVFAAILFIFPSLGEQADRHRHLLKEALRRLSMLSALALAFVVASGVINVAIRLGGFGNMLASSYGHVLIVKLFLVAAMVGIGGMNRFILIPRVLRWVKRLDARNRDALHALIVSLQADAILVLLILSAASMLVQGMPPMAEHPATMAMKHPHQ